MRSALATTVLAFVAISGHPPNASAAGGPFSCYEEEGTRRHLCYDSRSIRVNGSIRAAPYATGGPNGVRPSGYTLVVDCAKGITTLQDSDGVNFGGNVSAATPATRSLSKWICEEKKVKTDKKLRMF